MSGNVPNNINRFGNPQPPGVPFPVVLTPEQFQANQRYILQLAELNRVGLNNYQRTREYLSQKIVEGQRAQQYLQLLQQLTNTRSIAGPPPLSANPTVSLPNLNVNVPAYPPTTAVPTASLVNRSSALPMNAQSDPVTNSNSFAVRLSSEVHSKHPEYDSKQAPSNGHRNFRVQLPVSNIANVSTDNVSQGTGQQRMMSNMSMDVPSVQFAPSSSGSSRTVPPMSASHTHHQSHPNVSVNAVPGPSRNHTGIQQGRPNSYPAASYQAPNVGVSSHMGTGQGMPVSGPSREARYTTSSSSLAGALDETPYARGLSAAVPQTTVNKQDHRTVEQVASNVSATLPATSGRRDNVRSWAINEILSGGAVETALASLSDEELRLAQREIDSIARNQSQGTSIPLSKHSLDAAHHSNSSVPRHQAQDAPAISSGGFTAAPLSNTPHVHAGNVAQSTLRVVTHSGETISTSLAHIPQHNAPISGSRSSGPDTLTTFAVQRPRNHHGRHIQDYISASVAAQNAIPPMQFQSQAAIPTLQPQPEASKGTSNPPQADPSRFCTPPPPPPDKNRSPGPVTPASANKKTLAKDILRALNKVPEKRKASTPESTMSDAELEPPPSKRQDIGAQQYNVPVMVADLFTMPAILPVETHAVDSARIEEVEDDPEYGKGVESSPVAVATGRDPQVGNPEGIEGTKIEELEYDLHGGFDFQHAPPTGEGGSPGPRNLVPLDTTIHSVPTVPDSLPSYSAVESRASTDGELDADTALQPGESPSAPLFLPSRESSPQPFTPKKRNLRGNGSATPAPVPSNLSLPAVPVRERGRRMKVYVEVPVLTEAQRELFYLKEGPVNAPLTNQPAHERSETQAAMPQMHIVDEGRRRAAHEAVAISASRLEKRPCLWSDCGLVFNSANSLKFHVLEHVESTPDKEKIFPCWWGECMRRFNKREALGKHLQNHVGRCITCAYEGCQAILGHPYDYLDHVEMKHPSGGNLRPSVQPIVPTLKPVPPLGRMFSYHIVNLPIRPATILPERHGKLGPWVLRNCFGTVNLGALRYNVRNQLVRRRIGEAEPRLLGDWQDRYDFLEPWPSTYPMNCADLESAKATEEIEHGLVLLPDKAGPRGALREQLLTSRADRVKPLTPEKFEIRPEPNHIEEQENEGSEIKVEASSPLMLQEDHSRSVSEGPLDSYPDFLGLGDSSPPVIASAA